MKLSRKWILVAALVMSVAMATSGTLAYLTDRDSEVNVFTFGNVDIELNEEFTQGTALVPGVNIEKEPTITNVGKNSAWVWATIAIPAELDNDDASKNVIHFNMSKESVAEGQWSWWTEEDTDRTHWLKEYNVKVPGDDVEYNVFTVLYTSPLKAGETTTTPVMYKVYMDPHIDIDPEGNLHHVEGGVVTDIKWNINDNGAPTILLAAYAIQVEGFENVYAAYKAYNDQWGENGGVEYVSNLSAANSAELATAVAATKNGVVSITEDIESDVNVLAGNDVTLNLGGNTLNGNINASGDVAIVDGTVKNDARGVETSGDAQLTNVTVEAGSATEYGVVANGGDVTYDNVDIISGGGAVGIVNGAKAVFNSGSVEVDSTSTSGRYLFYLEDAGSELTINGGDFDFNKTQNQKRAYVYASADTTVYIKGGTFGEASTRSGYTAGLLGEGTIIVTGGTFGFNPSAFVPDTHEAVKTGDVWVVSAK